MKYSTLLDEVDKQESLSPFENVVKEEAKNARNYYTWKGLSRLTSHKRSYFNYASFLVFAFGWIGVGLTSSIKTGAESGEISGAYLIGCTIMLFSAMLMAYCRYDSTLYSRYLDLNSTNRYIQSYAAVHQARSKVLDESIFPILFSFIGGALVAYFFDQNIVNIVVCGVILICNIGNSIQIANNDKKIVAKEEERTTD